jgi:ubiquinone/menaquinone biosynthesis C-methylase UbiE
MTDQAERYDRIAEGYARWWAPVIAPAALRILDRLQPAIDAGARRLIDVGIGTGTLAIAAIRRWPEVVVVGIDASRGMADTARHEADRLLSASQRGRLDVRVAFADDLQLPAASFDAAMSSFVFQLVPNRARALREARRVLKPSGTLAYVSWLAEDRVFAPDVEFDDALDETGIGAREPDDRPGDLESVGGAVAQMRRAGFRDVRATRGLLEHPFEVEGYVRFMTEFDEEDLVRSLATDERDRFISSLRARLAQLHRDALVLRLPTVAVTGIRT